MQRSARPLTLLKKQCLQASHMRVFSRALTTAEHGTYRQQQPSEAMALTCQNRVDYRTPPPAGKKLYETHVPISKIERTVLTAASAVAALNNPLRGGKS